MKHKLRLEDLKNGQPGQVLFSGMIEDNQNGLFINGTNKLLKYVAVRGIGYYDWTIYREDCYRDMIFSEVKMFGHKLLKSNAKLIVEASKEVWDLWRD